MATPVRTARCSRLQTPDRAAFRRRDPVGDASPTATFFRAGRAAAGDDDGSPLGRALSAVVVFLAMYGLLVALTVALGGAGGG